MGKQGQDRRPGPWPGLSPYPEIQPGLCLLLPLLQVVAFIICGNDSPLFRVLRMLDGQRSTATAACPADLYLAIQNPTTLSLFYVELKEAYANALWAAQAAGGRRRGLLDSLLCPPPSQQEHVHPPPSQEQGHAGGAVQNVVIIPWGARGRLHDPRLCVHDSVECEGGGGLEGVARGCTLVDWGGGDGGHGGGDASPHAAAAAALAPYAAAYGPSSEDMIELSPKEWNTYCSCTLPTPIVLRLYERRLACWMRSPAMLKTIKKLCPMNVRLLDMYQVNPVRVCQALFENGLIVKQANRLALTHNFRSLVRDRIQPYHTTAAVPPKRCPPEPPSSADPRPVKRPRLSPPPQRQQQQQRSGPEGEGRWGGVLTSLREAEEVRRHSVGEEQREAGEPEDRRDTISLDHMLR